MASLVFPPPGMNRNKSRKLDIQNTDNSPPENGPGIIDPIPQPVSTSKKGGGLLGQVLKKQLPPPSMITSTVVEDVQDKEKYRSLPWNNYFDWKICKKIRDEEFNIYVCEKEHKDENEVTENELAFVLIHGAGLSPLSWALCASVLKKYGRVLAIELRGHHDEKANCSQDISKNSLVEGIELLLLSLLEEQPFPFMIIGHSMGGAMAVWSSSGPLKEYIKGVGIIDMVEGTALEAVRQGTMANFLNNRPKYFPSIEKAIEWSVSNKVIRNLESARVSVPPQLCNFVNYSNDMHQKFGWKINLPASEAFWEGWFKGLSSSFLSLHCPRLLILAGTDRLDRELIIGQMQGKYQLELLPTCGHCIHEDEPVVIAETIARFAQRYGLLTGKSPIQLTSKPELADSIDPQNQ